MSLPSTILKRISPYLHLFSEVGRGWFPLLEEMDQKLAELYPDYTITQVKEKFGLLRVYADGIGKEGYDIIDEYEQKSGTVCEVCGETGRTVNIKGWLKTLCPTHEQRRLINARLD